MIERFIKFGYKIFYFVAHFIYLSGANVAKKIKQKTQIIKENIRGFPREIFYHVFVILLCVLFILALVFLEAINILPLFFGSLLYLFMSIAKAYSEF